MVKMVEVPEHLAPMDGLSNWTIRLDTVRAVRGTGAGEFEFAFEYIDDGEVVGRPAIISFEVEPTGDGLDEMYARAYQHAINVLRQGIYRLEFGRKVHEKRAASSNPSNS